MGDNIKKGISPEELEESKKKLLKEEVKQGELDLSGRDLTYVDVCALSALIAKGQFPNMSSLVLRNNNLTDEGLCQVAASLNCDTTIKKLDLADNLITQRGIYHLLLCLTTFNETLEEISLENNPEIDPVGVRYAAEILENNSSLKTFNFNGIDLEACSDILANGLKKNKTITSLTLQSTGLDTLSTRDLLLGLMEDDSCFNVKELNISFNPIQDARFEVYDPIFTHAKFRCLRVLHLSFNQMLFNAGNKFSQVLGQGLARNDCLEEIYLRGNLFNDEDAKHLSLAISSPRSKLTKIDLSDNCITIIGMRSMLLDIKRNTKLKHLPLQDNNFLDEDGGKEMHREIQQHLARNRGETPRSKPKQKAHEKRDSPATIGLRGKRAASTDERSEGGDNLEEFDDDFVNSDEAENFFENEKRSFSAAKLTNASKLGKESNMFTSEPVVNMGRRVARIMNNLSNEFPQTKAYTKSRQKRNKNNRRSIRRARQGGILRRNVRVNKIVELKQQRELEAKEMPTLSRSLISQRMISQGLSQSARLVAPATHLLGLNNATIPSMLLDELTGQFDEARTNIPDVSTIERFSQSVKLITTALWCVYQSFVDFKYSDRTVCKNFLQTLFKTLNPDEEFSGEKMMQSLVVQIFEALVLFRPLYCYAEAMFLVMSSVRKNMQSQLIEYEVQDVKEQERANRHIEKRMKKVKIHNAKENLKKRLQIAKENKATKSVAGSVRDSVGSTGEKNSKLKKVLEKVERVKKMEEKKKKRNKERKSTEGSRINAIKQMRSLKDSMLSTVSEEVLKFRENCPERVDDALEDLKCENDVLLNLLSLEPMLETMLLFANVDTPRAHIVARVTALSKVTHLWFQDLNEGFNVQDLDHLRPEILKDIAESHKTIVKLNYKKPRTSSMTDFGGAPTSDTTNSRASQKVKNLVRRFQRNKAKKMNSRNNKRKPVKEINSSSVSLTSSASAKEPFDPTLIDAMLLGALTSSKSVRAVKTLKAKKEMSSSYLKTQYLAERIRSYAGEVCKESVSKTAMNLKEQFEALLREESSQ